VLQRNILARPIVRVEFPRRCCRIEPPCVDIPEIEQRFIVGRAVIANNIVIVITCVACSAAILGVSGHVDNGDAGVFGVQDSEALAISVHLGCQVISGLSAPGPHRVAYRRVMIEDVAGKAHAVSSFPIFVRGYIGVALLTVEKAENAWRSWQVARATMVGVEWVCGHYRVEARDKLAAVGGVRVMHIDVCFNRIDPFERDIAEICACVVDQQRPCPRESYRDEDRKKRERDRCGKSHFTPFIIVLV